jgi:hypothetical protein
MNNASNNGNPSHGAPLFILFTLGSASTFPTPAIKHVRQGTKLWSRGLGRAGDPVDEIC